MTSSELIAKLNNNYRKPAVLCYVSGRVVIT